MTILHRVGQPRGHEGIDQLNKTGRDTPFKNPSQHSRRDFYILQDIFRYCMYYTFIQQKHIQLTKSDRKDLYMLQKINI